MGKNARPPRPAPVTSTEDPKLRRARACFSAQDSFRVCWLCSLLIPRVCDTHAVILWQRASSLLLLHLYCQSLAQMVRPSTPSSPASHLYFFHPPLLLSVFVALVALLIVMSSNVEYATAAPDSVWASLQAARPHLAAGAVARFVSISAV